FARRSGFETLSTPHRAWVGIPRMQPLDALAGPANPFGVSGEESRRRAAWSMVARRMWHHGQGARLRMKAVEFESTVAPGGQIALPPEVASEIPPGEQLRVVVMWEPGDFDLAWR